MKITRIEQPVFTITRQFKRGTFAILMALLCLTTPWTLAAEDRHLLVVGDSLSAAYGISVEDGWVARLQHRLDGTRHPLKVVNASVSGDTSANGLTKLPKLLQEYDPVFVILELGGNDGLRGLSLKKLKQNLREMTDLAQQANATVIILGMQIPSNYGAAYTRLFKRTFTSVAEESGALLVPFFLNGLETGLQWFQSDGIHPNADAQEIMLDNVWAVLAPALETATTE